MQEDYSELVTNMDMLSNLKTFHEYNLNDIVDVAHGNALLSYGKNAPSNRRCLQRACHSCQMSYFDLVQEPRLKLRAH